MELQQKEENEDLYSTLYSCIECEWCGEGLECDIDSEWDEFKHIDRKYPICPKCGGGLEC